MVTLIQITFILLMYIYISVGSFLTGGADKQREQLKTDYRDFLNDKNRIECSAVKVAHTVSSMDLLKEMCGKGYKFEQVEEAVKSFKAKYINKMIKVTGRIKWINYKESAIVFENTSKSLLCWGSVRAIVDNPTVYKDGEIVTVVGRCIGSDIAQNLYIDCGQIEQELPSDSVEAYVSVNKSYDEAITVKKLLGIYKTYGDGNIMKGYFDNKVFQIKGYVVSTDYNRVELANQKNPNLLESRIYIILPGAKYIYKEGEEVKINATFNHAENILESLYFDYVN